MTSDRRRNIVRAARSRAAIRGRSGSSRHLCCTARARVTARRACSPPSPGEIAWVASGWPVFPLRCASFKASLAYLVRGALARARRLPPLVHFAPVSKAFKGEDASEAPLVVPARAPLPPGVDNYVTPRGL